MAVRSTMASLISSVRVLINDTGGTPVFTDQIIQDVMDESREDMRNVVLTPKPTFSGGTIQYLDYYYTYGGWEDDYVLKQYLTVTVTPSSVEPIASHFVFSSNTFPPCYITGKVFDRYRSAADLLERWSAQLILNYDFTSDGQSFRRSQASVALITLAKQYRAKQRPRSISTFRSDMHGGVNELSLAPTALDYMSSGH